MVERSVTVNEMMRKTGIRVLGGWAGGRHGTSDLAMLSQRHLLTFHIQIQAK